jgi:glutathione synthase/RimK-type ligase-like ATP-grasp enzyme
VTDVLLVTSADFPDGEPGGELIVKALSDRGAGAAWAQWDDPTVDWSAADLVAVRSTWDYHHRLPEFLAWAELVERWSVLLHGSSVFRWNTDKSYLLQLEGAGVPIVPTVLLDEPDRLADAAAGFHDTARVLVKPRVGAGGEGLVVLDAAPDLGLPVTLERDQGPWVVQPVVESVRTVGELSVFVFGGAPISKVRKLPAGEEVRVHEEYGGAMHAVPLDDEAALLATETVAAAQQLLGTELAYARVDLMRLDDGRLAVGELELVEPGFYLDVLGENAEPFADVVLLALAGGRASAANERR